ncbi:hypothetical protein MnTg02_01877 [bacterium MnTg02]|nr:hypothetical protein MnTg02_01877 [bacterium MnTg02]
MRSGRKAARTKHYELNEFPPFSYRDDVNVPDFPDNRPLLVFDGVCVLCTGFAHFILSHDRKKQFLLTTAQSKLGQALFRHYRLDPVDFETNLLIMEGRAFGKLIGFAEIMKQLGGPWRLFGALRYIPTSLGDWIYDRIAQNRYQLFGRHQNCMVPEPEWRGRIIT